MSADDVGPIHKGREGTPSVESASEEANDSDRDGCRPFDDTALPRESSGQPSSDDDGHSEEDEGIRSGADQLGV